MRFVILPDNHIIHIQNIGIHLKLQNSDNDNMSQ